MNYTACRWRAGVLDFGSWQASRKKNTRRTDLSEEEPLIVESFNSCQP